MLFETGALIVVVVSFLGGALPLRLSRIGLRIVSIVSTPILTFLLQPVFIGSRALGCLYPSVRNIKHGQGCSSACGELRVWLRRWQRFL